MASITAPGIGSGLDVNSIVSQLMALERRPLDQLDSRKSQINAQISAFGTLKSALSTFASAMTAMRDGSKFQPYVASSSSETKATASVGEGASPGRFALTITRLASGHKLSSAVFPEGTAVGTGTLNFTVGGESFSVVIDSTNNTLDGIRDAINTASGNTKVSASVINSTTGPMLLLSANESGAANAITVSVTGDGDNNNTDTSGLSALSYVGGARSLTQRSQALDAQITVDGISVLSPSNDVANAVDGITFHLKATGTPNPTIAITRDDTAITKAAQDYAKAYNDLKDTIAKLRQGELASDSILRSVESTLNSVLQTGANVGGNFAYLTEVGVSLDRFGKMQVDTGRLAEALGNNPSAVIGLFTHATEGFPVRLKAAAEALTRSDGLIAGREEGLNSRVRTMDSQRSQIERRLEMTEARLRAQFSALDSLVSQLQSTSAFLAQRLAALNDS
jgi:flagellar hook-associated protein 2